MDCDAQLTYLTKGCVDVVQTADLQRRLDLSNTSGNPLNIKVGFDPTAPDLHLGHTVLIRKMKHFQDLGHRVVFVIGDFTGLIGDPTGRSKIRPALSRSEIDANAETYKEQIFKLLDPEKTVVEFNSRWLARLGSDGWVRLAARYNVAQMLERRDFRKRYDQGQPIAIHEFLYPLAQAYDSVYLKTDVELGGTDQLFNLNVGRDIMPSFGVKPQIVMTTPLLVGIDGAEKMSKSAANYVGISEQPNDMFGKLMSISDSLMWDYYKLLTDLSIAEIDSLQCRVRSGDLHPKQAKVDLAVQIISDFHSVEAARAAAVEFERRFSQKELPVDLEIKIVGVPDGGILVTRLILDCGFAASNSAASRLVEQGSVRIDGEQIVDRRFAISSTRGAFVLQVGKRRVVKVVPKELS